MSLWQGVGWLLHSIGFWRGPSPFETLPREIRDIIYHFYYSSFDNSISVTSPSNYNLRCNLFYVNKQISHESQDIFYRYYFERVYFNFTGVYAWLSFTRHIGRIHPYFCGQAFIGGDETREYDVGEIEYFGLRPMVPRYDIWRANNVEDMLKSVQRIMRFDSVDDLEEILLQDAEIDGSSKEGNPWYICGASGWKLKIQYWQHSFWGEWRPSRINLSGALGRFCYPRFRGEGELSMTRDLDESEFPFQEDHADYQRCIGWVPFKPFGI